MEGSMGTRHLLLTGLSLSVLVAAGCRPNQPATSSAKVTAAARPQASVAVPATQPVADGPIISDPPAVMADSLAQKANSYAKNLEPMLNKRAARSTGHPTNPPAVADASDQVHFIDPKSAALQPGPEPAKAANGEAVASNQAFAPKPANSDGSGAKAAPKEDAAAPTQPPRREVAANLGARPAAPTGPTVDELTRRLSQRVKDYPQDVAGQFEFQLLQYLRGEPVPNLQTLNGLPNEDREIVSALMDGLSNFRSALRTDNNMLLSRKIQPILDLADRLRSQAELSLPTVAICSEVKRFGLYTPVEPARFAAGSDPAICVYCEVENFASQLNSNKLWETKLRMDLVLYEDQGLEVWSPDKKRQNVAMPTIEATRAHRHDFFLTREIHLPKSLPVGRYILKVTVVDMQANRIAENSVPLEIVIQ
jgi:hypothetical protein